MDYLSEAQAVQALIAAGLPKKVAFKSLSFVDDVDEVMRLIEDEQDDIPELEDGQDLDADAGTEGLLQDGRKQEDKPGDKNGKSAKKEITDG